MRSLSAAIFVVTILASGAVADAQEADKAEVRQEGWEYQSAAGELTPQQIIRQKAQARAAQRMTRMDTLRWYGYSVARPRTASTPFTSMYGAQWQGTSYSRPQAWHTARSTKLRPTVYVGY